MLAALIHPGAFSKMRNTPALLIFNIVTMCSWDTDKVLRVAITMTQRAPA
jgi:hypothetical protein